MSANFKVQVADAKGFSEVWKHSGVFIPMQDVNLQFATDFANVVLNNFIVMCQQNAQAVKQKAEADAAPKITLE